MTSGTVRQGAIGETAAEQTRVAGDTLLEVAQLTIEFPRRRQPPLVAVASASFSIRRGTVVGIVGESGSGKTMTANAVMRLLPPAARVTSGEIWFAGESLLDLPEEEMRRRRGKR